MNLPEYQDHDVTVEIDGQPRKLCLRLSHRSESQTGRSGASVYLSAPFVYVFAPGATDRGLFALFPSALVPTADDDSALYRQVTEVVLFASPRMAEIHLGTFLEADPPPDTQDRLRVIHAWDPDNAIAWKEEAAGETYEQRSHMCYEDACQIARSVWRDPHNQTKAFSLQDLHDSTLKRRTYEETEWINVLRWGEGEGYWRDESKQVSRAERLSRYVLEGANVRRLEASLTRAGLGVLSEIAGRIDLSSGMNFLSGSFRDTLLRDCREINEAAKVGAAKAVIVMCGSVVEALLYDLVSADEPKAQAAAATVPEVANWHNKPVDRWTAFPLIKVAHALDPIKVSADAAAYADVLRDYRNLIHPGKAERSSREAGQHTAAIAISVVNLLVEGLT